MNSIKDLLPGSMRERTFQLKARRDAGAVWNDPQFVECKKCGRRATRQIWNKAQYVCPNCGRSEEHTSELQSPNLSRMPSSA